MEHERYRVAGSSIKSKKTLIGGGGTLFLKYDNVEIEYNFVFNIISRE